MDILEDSSEKNLANDKLITPQSTPFSTKKDLYPSANKYIIGRIDDKFPKDHKGWTTIIPYFLYATSQEESNEKSCKKGPNRRHF
jgi:hypothetical protein